MQTRRFIYLVCHLGLSHNSRDEDYIPGSPAATSTVVQRCRRDAIHCHLSFGHYVVVV